MTRTVTGKLTVTESIGSVSTTEVYEFGVMAEPVSSGTCQPKFDVPHYGGTQPLGDPDCGHELPPSCPGPGPGAGGEPVEGHEPEPVHRELAPAMRALHLMLQRQTHVANRVDLVLRNQHAIQERLLRQQDQLNRIDRRTAEILRRLRQLTNEPPDDRIPSSIVVRYGAPEQEHRAP